MPGKVTQKREFLEDFAVQDNNIDLVGPNEDLPNPGSNNLVGGGINLPFVVAEKGFRVYDDPNDQRPVLEINSNPAKIPPPNTPVGLCANTKLIGLCCDDHKDTTQTLRVNCQPCMYIPAFVPILSDKLRTLTKISRQQSTVDSAPYARQQTQTSLAANDIS